MQGQRDGIFGDHTKLLSNCDSFTLSQIENNKVSQLLHIKEMLPTKCQL